MAEEPDVTVRDPAIAGGEPIFRGARVPVATLLEHLEDGGNLDEFIADFPTVERDDALTLPRAAHRLVAGHTSTH